MDQDETRKKRLRLFGNSTEGDAPPSFANNPDSHAIAGSSAMSVKPYLTGDVMDTTPEAQAVRAWLADLSCAQRKQVLESIDSNDQYAHDTCNCKDPVVDCYVLLARFDCNTKHNKVTKSAVAPQKATPSTGAAGALANMMRANKSPVSNGIGYGGDGSDDEYEDGHGWEYEHGFGKGRRLGDDKAGPKGTATTEDLVDEDDRLAAGVMGALASLLNNPNPSDALPALLVRSSILDRAADLLVNTSVDDIIGRAALYLQLANFIGALTAFPTTAAVLYTPRTINKAGHNILRVAMGLPTLTHADTEEKAQPLAHCMAGLSRQCEMMGKNARVLGDESITALCKAINKAFDAVVKANVTDTTTADSAEPTEEAAVTEVPDHAILRDYSLRNAANDFGGVLAKHRMKRIMTELITLLENLPPGIFIRYGAGRPDCMKVLIVAPKDTPYENGLFEFDLLCPADYPQSPPQMQFKTTGNRSFYFNPNLYADGKVCLSLLGTWSGAPWKPGKSTIYQVLVSIQAMIFCENPWCNEPGREGLEDTPQSKAYNRTLHPKTVEFAMLGFLGGNSNNIWRDVVAKHFHQHQEDILQTIGKWKDDQPAPQKSGHDKSEAKKPADFPGLPGLPGLAAVPFGQSGHSIGGPTPPQDDDDESDRDEDNELDPMTKFPPPPSAPAPPKPKSKSLPFGNGHTIGGGGISFGTPSSKPPSKPVGYANPFSQTLPLGFPSSTYQPSFISASPALSQPPPLLPGLFPTYQGTGWAGQKPGGEDDAEQEEEDDDDDLEVITEKVDQEEATTTQQDVAGELAEFAVKLRQAVKDLQSQERLGNYGTGGAWADLDME